jgi:hypothetical protein
MQSIIDISPGPIHGKIWHSSSHEQINPTDLLNDVIIMERYGIEKCWSSDHYMSWWHTTGLQAAQLGLGLGQRLPKQIG